MFLPGPSCQTSLLPYCHNNKDVRKRVAETSCDARFVNVRSVKKHMWDCISDDVDNGDRIAKGKPEDGERVTLLLDLLHLDIRR